MKILILEINGNVKKYIGYVTSEMNALDVCTLLNSTANVDTEYYFEKVYAPLFDNPCLDYMIKNK